MTNTRSASHFILYVEDQERSTAFYASVLALSPRLHVPGMTEFDLPGGGVLGLMPEHTIQRLLGAALPDPARARGVPRAELYLVVDAADTLHARALAAGAVELSPMQPRDWGASVAYSLDLDGHVLAFARSAERADEAVYTSSAGRLGREVASTFGGDPWYGTPLVQLLAGVDARTAAAHPVPGAHSIWELVLHLSAWANEVTRRLLGKEHLTPTEGDWPSVVATDDASWRAAVDGLRRAHEELALTLARLDDARLASQVSDAQVDAHGEPVTLHQTVIGLLQHDAYHAGQLALLKKLLAGRGPTTA